MNEEAIQQKAIDELSRTLNIYSSDMFKIKFSQNLEHDDDYYSFWVDVFVEFGRAPNGEGWTTGLQIDYHYEEDEMYVITGEDTQWELDSQCIWHLIFFDALSEIAEKVAGIDQGY